MTYDEDDCQIPEVRSSRAALTATASAWVSFCFCAGQIPLAPDSGQLVDGDIRAQTERCLENIKLILDSEGLTLDNVVKTTVFMTNLGNFALMNETYARFFVKDFPARTTVQVAALPRGAQVEIEAIAHY